MTEHPVAAARKVVVLDEPAHTGRRLAETVRGAGLAAEDVPTLEAIPEALRGARARVAVLALEALEPSPEAKLRKLREQSAGVRLIVVYSDEAPRLALAQRLWMVGLLDYLVPRSLAPHELTPVLRQAQADALIEEATHGPANDEPLTPLGYRLRLLQQLAAAFATQWNVEGLLRELHMKLPQLLDYNMLEVLLLERPRARIHVQQTRPAVHEAIWQLAERTCAALDPFVEHPLRPEQMELVAGSPPPDAEADPVANDDGAVLTLPMVVRGEVVGCLGLQTAPGVAVGPEERSVLQLVAHQLATSITHAQSLRAAERASLIDELTGAHNRRFMRRTLETEWRRAKRYKAQLTVAMVDLDRFKQLNDEFGHLVGDEVLRTLASLMRQHLRDTDHLVRYGGDEFLLLLPETGPSEGALVLERLRLVLARQPLRIGGGARPLLLAFSAGVASFPSSSVATVEELVELADRALLAAKRSGRGRTCLASGQGFTEPSGVLELADLEGGKRRFPRVPAEIKVRYVELPDFQAHVVPAEATDISPGGIAVRDPERRLQQDGYALVYLEEDEKPLLSQVVWSSETPTGEPSAGLRFLKREELGPGAQGVGLHPALVVAQDGVPHERLFHVLRAAGYAPQRLDDQTELLLPLGVYDYPLLLAGPSDLRGWVGARLREVPAVLGTQQRIIVLNGLTGDAQPREDDDPGVTSEDRLWITLSKLVVGQYFGLKKYLQLGAEPTLWAVGDARQRTAALDQLRAVTEQARCTPHLVEAIVAGLEELTASAIRPPSTHPDRPTRPVLLECGSDGELLAIALVDEHGQLSAEVIYDALGLALLPNEEKRAGAAPWAAFRSLVQSLDQLAVNIEPGSCTELVGILNLQRGR
ncbi:MAG: diguanylate cyclase [Deltaproteobacteria bacterium]|nr:diguanylate cyclase [Deltaproteobacteria bacterium]